MQTINRRTFNTNLLLGGALVGCAIASRTFAAVGIQARQADAFIDLISVFTHFYRSNYQGNYTAGAKLKQKLANAGIRHIRDRRYHVLLQKRTGVFYLAIWLGKQIWNPKTQPITVNPQAVMLTLRRVGKSRRPGLPKCQDYLELGEGFQSTGGPFGRAPRDAIADYASGDLAGMIPQRTGRRHAQVWRVSRTTSAVVASTP